MDYVTRSTAQKAYEDWKRQEAKLTNHQVMWSDTTAKGDKHRADKAAGGWTYHRISKICRAWTPNGPDHFEPPRSYYLSPDELKELSAIKEGERLTKQIEAARKASRRHATPDDYFSWKERREEQYRSERAASAGPRTCILCGSTEHRSNRCPQSAMHGPGRALYRDASPSVVVRGRYERQLPSVTLNQWPPQQHIAGQTSSGQTAQQGSAAAASTDQDP